MAYLLTLGDETFRAAVEETGPDRYQITMGDEVFHVDARKTGGQLYSLIVGHKVIEADVQKDGDGQLSILVDGDTFNIQAMDERRKRLRAAAGVGGAKGGTIVTPMPGKVVRILAPAGTEVKAGDGVLVLEAMKMENEMESPIDGVVKEIHVEEGQAVDGGVTLATVEP